MIVGNSDHAHLALSALARAMAERNVVGSESWGLMGRGMDGKRVRKLPKGRWIGCRKADRVADGQSLLGRKRSGLVGRSHGWMPRVNMYGMPQLVRCGPHSPFPPVASAGPRDSGVRSLVHTTHSPSIRTSAPPKYAPCLPAPQSCAPNCVAA